MKNLKSILALLVLTVFSVNAWGETYTKVTSAPDDWSGEYLLVYERTGNDAGKAYVWTGVDATKCHADATIVNNQIVIVQPSNAVSITIASMTGGYSIQVNGGTKSGKYLDRTSYDNGMDFLDNPSANTLSYENNSVVITGSVVGTGNNAGKRVTIRYNNSSGDNNERFRYYKSGQQAVQLYKKEPDCTAPTTPLSISATPSPIALNKTAEISTEGGNGGTITYKVTPSTGKVENGIFSATATGTYKVSAHQDLTADGVCEQNDDVTITVGPIQFGDYVTECCTKWDAPTVTYTTPLAAGGTTATPTITGTTHGTASYVSSNEAVLTVDNDGTIHPQGAGTAYITVTWGESTEGNVDYCENQAISNTITVTGNISVAFDAKGGEGKMENQSIPSGEPTKLNTCEFTKTGYAFQGWDTDPAGETVVYEDEAEVTLSAGCTLYAVWEINSYNVTFTPSIDGQGSITVNGKTTSPVNVDYNATVTIEMNGINAHFNPATLTYKVGEEDAVDILTDKSFNMPAGNVTLSYSFAEAAFKTITFYNNGIQVGASRKAYVGEVIGALPEQGEMTSCDETSTSFIGWTAEDISEKAPAKPAMLTASTVITAESATAYNALWAEGGEATMPTPIIAWEDQAWEKNTAYSATVGTGSMTSSITLKNSSGGIARNGNAAANTNIVFSGLNLTGHSHIQLKFISRGSEFGTITASYSTNGTDYIDLPNPITITGALAGYTFNEIPGNATHVKLTYGASSGSFFFGIPKFMEYQPDTYGFEELTAENTSGWTGSDWDGTYLVVEKTGNIALDGGAPSEEAYFTITDNEGVITTTDLGPAFQISYEGDNGYAVKGIGSNYYISHGGGTKAALSASSSIKYISSVSFNSLTEGSYSLYHNSTSFKFYNSAFEPITLYKLLPTSTNYITTCCTQLEAPTIETVDAITANSANVSWTSVDDAKGYEYQVNNGDWTANATTSVTLTGLSAGTAYAVKVRATDNTGTYCPRGAMSDVKNFTTHYTIAIADGIENGSISCATHAAEEEKVTLTVNPATGYALFQLTANGEPLVLDNNQFTMPAANITLSAVFKNENIHLISYVKNNDEATGTMEDQEFTYGAGDVTLNKNNFEATDYDFLGWATSADGEKVYDDQAVVSDFTNANQVLYAVWKKHQFTVTLNAGTGTVETTSYTEDVHNRIELPAAAHCQPDVWAFYGWSERNVSEATSTAPEIVDATNYEITKNVELYAIYKKGDSQMIGYKISYQANSTTYYASSGVLQQKMSVTTNANDALIFGMTTTSGQSKLYQVDENGDAKANTYIYLNSGDSYKLYQGADGNGNGHLWTISLEGTHSIINVTKNDRCIAGRSGKADNLNVVNASVGNVDKPEGVDENYFHHITLVPVVKGAASYCTSPECVSLTWVNEMLDADPVVTYPANGKIVLPAETPTSCAPGLYSFVGWTATEIPTYKTTQQEIVTAETAAPEHATTYYAEFVNTAGNCYRTSCPDPLYAITYHANDGTDATYVVYTDLTTSTTPTAEQAGFVKEGATLIGWTLDPNAEELEYVAPGTRLTGINGDREYYAVWVGSLQMSAPVRLTSAKDATAGSAIFTLSSQDLGTITTLRFAYYDVDNDTWYRTTARSNSEFRLCNTNYTTTNAENNVDVTTSGVNFSKEYAIVYTPNSGNKMSHYQLVVELMVKNKVMATNTFDLYGRSLPDKFVIAEHRDNKWYALPANINDEAKARAGVEITVSGEGLNMAAVASENELYTLKTYNFDKNKVLFQSVANNGHLWAASGDNTGIKNDAKTISGQKDPYAWILTPTDETLFTYTLGNVNNNRTLAMNGTNFGMYASFATNTVYFLPINEYVVIRENLTNGKIGTMCQAKEIIAVKGGTLYQPNYEENNYLEFIEVTLPVAAGMPLIYQADGTNDGKLAVMYGTGDAVTAALTEGTRGMVGYIGEDKWDVPDYNESNQNYVFQNNKLLRANQNYLINDRAYVSIDAVHALEPIVEEPIEAPRRRLVMDVESRTTPTGWNDVLKADNIRKLIINDKMYILRAGKMYDATGKFVK